MKVDTLGPGPKPQVFQRVGMVVYCCLLGCATKQPLPPGDELEDRSVPARDPAGGEVGEDLLAKKDEPPPPTRASLKNVPDQSFPPDVRKENRERLLAALTQARAMASLPDARRALMALEPRAKELGPPLPEELLEARVRVALADKAFAEALTLARRWLLSCGPTETDGCRKKALAATEQAAEGLAGKAELQKKVALTRKDDECVRMVERQATAELPPCAAEALRRYRESRDRLMVARLLLAGALAQADDPKAFAKALGPLARAESACLEPRCREVRRRSLRARALLELRLGRPEESVRTAIREMALAKESETPEAQLYGFSQSLGRACAALDQAKGEGACRKLEKKLAGKFSFRDYSRGPPSGQGLTPEEVREVNTHFGVLLGECLLSEARRPGPPGVTRYAVRWVVVNEGRVEQVHLEPRAAEESLVGDCIRRQFAVWRYPRFEGEFQHVEQTFTVGASSG